nr:MAG TPA: hypothetical protein [Caudoviricetes sp.]
MKRHRGVCKNAPPPVIAGLLKNSPGEYLEKQLR